jgi:rhodanese-related sulfurtransferase
MRLLISLAVGLFAVLVFLACNSTERNAVNSPAVASSNHNSSTQVPPPPGDGVRRITPGEAQDLLTKGQAVVIDVRNQASYDAGHIRGAKLIPSNEFLNHIDELPRDKTIVTYCSWPNEHTSAGAVVNLKSKGMENGVALLGGFAAWENAGLPVDRKQ